jgi:carbon storage regulator CsrA
MLPQSRLLRNIHFHMSISREAEMLVLSRKNGESIRIGNEIEVKIVGIRNGQVRIAIDCPREISILREELTANRRTVPQIEFAGEHI